MEFHSRFHKNTGQTEVRVGGVIPVKNFSELQANVSANRGEQRDCKWPGTG